MRRGLILLVVCAGFLAAAPRAFAAGTTVSVSGTTATITVNVDVIIGAQNFTAADVSDRTRAYFEKMAREAQDYWNQGFAGRLYRGCTQFKLVVDERTLPGGDTHDVWPTDNFMGKATIDGRHVMDWMEGDYGGATARPTVYDPYLPDSPATDDYPTPYTHDLNGYWSPDMVSSRDFAHEVGHLMGLGDDYTDNGGSVVGRSGTLMDGGDAIDQNLVNRLGKIIEKAGIKLPSCWTGTIESDTSRIYLEGIYGGHTHCTDRWHATLGFDIVDGKIEGDGEARPTSKPTCYAGVGKLAKLQTFVVRGHATDQELTLRLVFDSVDGVVLAGWSANVSRFNGSHRPEPMGPPLSVPRIDPCTATGTVTVHDRLPSGGKVDPLTATDTIALKCPQPGST